MFPIGDHVLRRVDPFNLTALRYGIASLAFVALLVATEGRDALRLEGRGRELLVLGSLGFAGFNLLTYTGLEHTEPQNAAIIVATMPLVTALVRWGRDGDRPPAATFAAIAVALVGAALVVTRGHLGSGWGMGDVLIFGGVVGWVLYTTGAAKHPELSPLRYTTLSAVLGTLTIVAITAVSDVVGWRHVPSAADVGAEWPGIAFIVVFGAVVAVVAWNAGVRRLGPANAALFMNLVPTTAFVIRIAGGYRPVAAELAGASLVVAALVGANLAARRAAAAPAPVRFRPGAALPSWVRNA
jgi:drug/metabolite transporter (DMT)-like permease